MRKVLVVVDGSPQSENALQWTLQNFADPQNDKLLLLSIALVPEITTPFEYSAVTRNILEGGDEKTKIKKQQAEEAAKNVMENCRKNITEFYQTLEQNEITRSPPPFECDMKSGSDPASLIIDFANENSADLVVLGQCDTLSQDAYNVSQQCLHAATCPVVIVKNNKL